MLPSCRPGASYHHVSFSELCTHDGSSRVLHSEAHPRWITHLPMVGQRDTGEGLNNDDLLDLLEDAFSSRSPDPSGPAANDSLPCPPPPPASNNVPPSPLQYSSQADLQSKATAPPSLPSPSDRSKQHALYWTGSTTCKRLLERTTALRQASINSTLAKIKQEKAAEDERDLTNLLSNCFVGALLLSDGFV